MSRREVGFIVAGAAAMCIVVAVVWSIVNARTMDRYTRAVDSSRMLGHRAPDFAVVTNRGTFDSRRTTKPVVLEVFATWCGHCKKEVAALNALYRRHATETDFVAVSGSRYAIDGTSPETAADVYAFARNLKVQYPAGYDPSLGVAHAFLIGAYPTVLVIDRKKQVTFQAGGEVPEATIEHAIEAALAS